ncbi:MAG: FecCD family ABC transporter permease [Methylohalobius sp. ZOD2]
MDAARTSYLRSPQGGLFSRHVLLGPPLWFVVLIVAWAVLAIASLGLGRYVIPFSTMIDILRSPILPVTPYWNDAEEMVVLQLRLPRILAATLVGMALAMAGATLQGLLRNPLVDAHLIGISGGASLGGVLALFLALPAIAVVAASFGAGLIALILVFAISRIGSHSGVMALVLAGIITGSFFSALVSLVVFAADPEGQLPGIVYWLMGSFARVDFSRLGLLAVPTLTAGLLLYQMRWRINLLSLGDHDATGLGVNVERTRWILLSLIALMVGAQVAVSGGIGWVGLVIPHLARLLTGPDHRTLLPMSALLGGVFMLGIDDLARTLTAQELPVGLLAALVGTPVFGYLLWRRQSGWGGGIA